MAQTPETSDYTGIKDRIDDVQSNETMAENPIDLHQYERSEQGCNSGWMSPLQIDEALDPIALVDQRLLHGNPYLHEAAILES